MFDFACRLRAHYESTTPNTRTHFCELITRICDRQGQFFFLKNVVLRLIVMVLLRLDKGDRYYTYYLHSLVFKNSKKLK